jgi:hypothetical protein
VDGSHSAHLEAALLLVFVALLAVALIKLL